ncbi:hypothetical protein [Rhodoferax sp.]|uniref:hypothetical protein n=1 Tax=Rhodoferax sp. TaxID=50421 RepID=UPI00284AEF50|nr:hypothetical protein [Rhodoferax sp.]MDR3369284.1 hypothetical protein [Rhodoferax sp.]
MQDAQKFAAALSSDPTGVRSAIAAIGKQVDAVTTKELATNGRVTAEISALHQQNVTFAAQQKALATLEAALSSIQATASTASSNSETDMGLAAYQSNSMGFGTQLNISFCCG